MAELLNKHADLRPARMGDVRQRNLEVRGTSNLQGVTLTTVSGNSAAFTSISASMASFATITASEGYISILTVDSLISPATATSPISGRIEQFVEENSSTYGTTTATIPLDDTEPESGEGRRIFSATITPTYATGWLLIETEVNLASNTAGVNAILALFNGTTTLATKAVLSSLPAINSMQTIGMRYILASTATVARAFHVNVGPEAAGTISINGQGVAHLFGTAINSYLRITEFNTVQ